MLSRLSRLEQTVSALVERLDRGDAQRWEPETSNTPSNNPPHISNSPPGTPSAAPMFLIRDVASQVGVKQQQPPSFQSAAAQSRDIISKGLLTLQEASGMIELYVPIRALFLVLIYLQISRALWTLGLIQCHHSTTYPRCRNTKIAIAPLRLLPDCSTSHHPSLSISISSPAVPRCESTPLRFPSGGASIN